MTRSEVLRVACETADDHVRDDRFVLVGFVFEGTFDDADHDAHVDAHLSDGVLLSARSGEPLAYQVGSTFYDYQTRQPVYYEPS